MSGTARDVRHLLADLLRLEHVRGGLVVALDGLVIVAELPSNLAVEPLSALAATLGRELEIAAERSGSSRFEVGVFASELGTVFLAATPIGFILLLGGPRCSQSAITDAIRATARRIQQAWTAAPA